MPHEESRLPEGFDIWDILRGIGAFGIIIGLIAGLAFVENTQRDRLFARLAVGSPRGWVKDARAMKSGGFALYRVDAPKWTVVIPLVLIAVVLFFPRGQDSAALGLIDLCAVAALGVWAGMIAFRPDVVLQVEGAELHESRWLRGARLHDLSRLRGLAAFGGDFANGFEMSFETGRVVPVSANLGGVYQLARHLQSFHPDAQLIVADVDAYLREAD